MMAKKQKPKKPMPMPMSGGYKKGGKVKGC